MHICFLSYEYPPDTGVGGIGTYMRQISLLFASRKIYSEVICASPDRGGSFDENEWLTITRIKCKSREEFRTMSPAIVAERHRARNFNIIEVPEYGGDGMYIKDLLPGVPLVAKLHTPGFLVKELNDYYYDKLFLRKLKKATGLSYSKDKDIEYKALQKADHILSPSLSLIDIISNRWQIPREKIIHAPNPYFPNRALLTIPAGGSSKTILYIGRLETRKGVYNLAKAIPAVVKQIPDAKFIFLGKDSRGPMREKSMKKVMISEMGSAAGNTTFIDGVPLAEIPNYLSQADGCIFPSLWENFPNVCLEAMTAARGIIASREGGMKDMLENTGGGILINPHDVNSISESLVYLLHNRQWVRDAGIRNREKINNYYSTKLPDDLIATYRAL